jgi:hypothetical protein
MNEEQKRPEEYISVTKRALALMLADVADTQQEEPLEFMKTTSTGHPIREGAVLVPSRN